MKMTNFDVDQFMTPYEMIQEHVATNWNVGRGRRSLYKPKDVFLMFLTVMKHGGSWDFLARMFQISASSFERLVMKFSDTIGDVLFDTLVVKAEKKYFMQRLMRDKTVFSNFPFARYATDVTFQQCDGGGKEIFFREASSLRIETRTIGIAKWASCSL